MRILAFGARNAREILRDPLNLCFGIGFPTALLLLLSAIQASIPVDLFAIGHLAPGIAVFGLSFMTLFSATVIAKDRGSAFFDRLCTTPMRASDFILGYMLPMLPIAVAQSLVCYGVALLLGLTPSASILLAVLLVLPISLLFIALGLLCGSLLNDRQVGGVCGALLTNLSAWLSGIWFDLALVGGVFEQIAYALPFVHAVELERAILAGETAAALPHLLWVLGYAAALTAAAVWAFLWQARRR